MPAKGRMSRRCEQEIIRSDIMVAFFLRLPTPVDHGDAIATLSDKLVSGISLSPQDGFPCPLSSTSTYRFGAPRSNLTPVGHLRPSLWSNISMTTHLQPLQTGLLYLSSPASRPCLLLSYCTCSVLAYGSTVSHSSAGTLLHTAHPIRRLLRTEVPPNVIEPPLPPHLHPFILSNTSERVAYISQTAEDPPSVH